MDKRKASMFLAGVMPYYGSAVSRHAFKKTASGTLDVKELEDMEKSSRNDEDFFYMCLVQAGLGSDSGADKLFSALLEARVIERPVPSELSIRSANESEKPCGTVLPDKLLVIEDEGGVGVWKNFLKQYGVSGIRVVASKGYTNDKWESAVVCVSEIDPNYKPKVLRVFDRDGLSEEFVDKIREKIGEKYGSKFIYRTVFLNTYDVENLVLADPVYQTTTVSKKCKDLNQYLLSEEILEALELDFRTKVNAKLNDNNKALETEYGFNVSSVEALLKEAKKTPGSSFRGKKIINILNGSLKTSVTPEKILSGLEMKDFPPELLRIMQEIECFFGKG